MLATPKRPSLQERAVVFLLRLSGSITLMAVLAIFLPVEWMIEIHRKLGLGTFPESAAMDYLTRSVAALYAFHGGLLLCVSRDVRRYRGLVHYLAWATVGFGLALLGVGLHAGLPVFWVVGEGPPVAALGVLLLLLLPSVPAE